jgi:hypothetical protein
MPRSTKLELTPFRAGRCWKKYRNGKVYYVGKGQKKDDGSSPWDHAKYAGKRTDCQFYQAALNEWRAIESRMESDEMRGIDTTTPDYQRALKRWRRELVELLNSADTISILRLNDLLKHDANHDGLQPQLNFAYFAPPPSAIPVKARPSSTAIKDLIESYLNHQRAKVPSQFTVKHYKEMYEKLTYFLEFTQANELTDVSEITVARLQQFHNEQLYWLTVPKEQNGVNRATVKKRLDCLKNWLLWCEEIGLYQTPGYLLKFNKVKSPRIDPETTGTNGKDNPTFSVDEIRQLWQLATERMRLYLLLGLNCGFTQVDISTLHWNHYKADATIDRLRHKTKHHTHAIRQVFKLWPETNSLLLKFATAGDGLMLQTTTGNELVTGRINDDGSVTETDSIRLAFNRLRTQWFKQQIFRDHPELAKRCRTPDETKRKNDQLDELLKQARKADNRGFKVFRKSAANELEHTAKYKDLVSLFLAHSETATKKFYTNPDYSALVPATNYLRRIYGLKL